MQTLPRLHFDRVRVGLQVIHRILEPAIFLCQLPDLFLQGAIFAALLRVGGDAVLAEKGVPAANQGKDDGPCRWRDW